MLSFLAFYKYHAVMTIQRIQEMLRKESKTALSLISRGLFCTKKKRQRNNDLISHSFTESLTLSHGLVFERAIS